MNSDLDDYLYELRKLLLIYKAGGLPVNVFLNKSRQILDLIEPRIEGKADELHSAWFDIEQAYAVALDREQPLSNYQEYVNAGLSSMEGQITLLRQQH
jgi:hypothetical protein